MLGLGDDDDGDGDGNGKGNGDAKVRISGKVSSGGDGATAAAAVALSKVPVRETTTKERHRHNGTCNSHLPSDLAFGLWPLAFVLSSSSDSSEERQRDGEKATLATTGAEGSWMATLRFSIRGRESLSALPLIRGSVSRWKRAQARWQMADGREGQRVGCQDQHQHQHQHERTRPCGLAMLLALGGIGGDRGRARCNGTDAFAIGLSFARPSIAQAWRGEDITITITLRSLVVASVWYGPSRDAPSQRTRCTVLSAISISISYPDTIPVTTYSTSVPPAGSG
ncbi:hypothetical protein MMC19_000325 [Ptychographa xylographoides]|nr:hypothetical protein [Ptychographa xylographoides]